MFFMISIRISRKNWRGLDGEQIGKGEVMNTRPKMMENSFHSQRTAYNMIYERSAVLTVIWRWRWNTSILNKNNGQFFGSSVFSYFYGRLIYPIINNQLVQISNLQVSDYMLHYQVYGLFFVKEIRYTDQFLKALNELSPHSFLETE